jgi:GT2 family glycosyltransferase
VTAVDLVTVFHNATNRSQAYELADQVYEHADADYCMWFGDNSIENVGFGHRCNEQATHGAGEIIGFLNPDSVVSGPFMQRVLREFAKDDALVITGERFGKASGDIRSWGLRDWVCGAAFFVRRDWFQEVGGFHEGYVWGWEETDLCRLAETTGKTVKSIVLPIYHASPIVNSPEDVAFKHTHFERGALLYRKRWGR